MNQRGAQQRNFGNRQWDIVRLNLDRSVTFHLVITSATKLCLSPRSVFLLNTFSQFSVETVNEEEHVDEEKVFHHLCGQAPSPLT